MAPGSNIFSHYTGKTIRVQGECAETEDAFFVSGCGSEHDLSSMEQGNALEAEHENTSQIVYTATIEKQIYLSEDENLSTEVPGAEGLKKRRIILPNDL